MQCIQSASEVPPGAGVSQLPVPGLTVGVLIDRRWVADGVDVTRCVISARPELIREDEAVEFWPWIEEAMELLRREVSLSPASVETGLLAGEVEDSPKAYTFVVSGQYVQLELYQREGFGKA